MLFSGSTNWEKETHILNIFKRPWFCQFYKTVSGDLYVSTAVQQAKIVNLFLLIFKPETQKVFIYRHKIFPAL